jgi:hypothetical protein
MASPGTDPSCQDLLRALGGAWQPARPTRPVAPGAMWSATRGVEQPGWGTGRRRGMRIGCTGGQLRVAEVRAGWRAVAAFGRLPAHRLLTSVPRIGPATTSADLSSAGSALV